MFAFPKFIQVGLYSGGVNMEEKQIFRIFIGFHIWGEYIFCWGGGVYTGGVFKGFYDIRIKD